MRLEDTIYELIPATDFLRHLKSAINWSLVNKYCCALYSEKGRPVRDARSKKYTHKP